MTSLLDNFDTSDSENDSDYKPGECEISSDEEAPFISSDEEQEGSKKRKPRRKGVKNVVDTFENETKETPSSANGVEEKKKADDIYKSFLDEVAAEMSDSKHESPSSGISCGSSPIVWNKAVSSQSSTASTPSEVFEFAGETVAVKDGKVQSVESDLSDISNSKIVTPDSATSGSPDISHSKLDKQESASSDSADIPRSLIQKQAPSAAAPPPPIKRKGLESVLGALQNKKQKLTVMQKSMLDWKTFKKEESLEEELEQYNRGKGGFIERQRFLQRSDVRSYEIERDMRISKRPTQTKRDT